MTTVSILSQNFDVPETSKTFLENYIERVRSYIMRNQLDMSMFNDLLERLVEKLSEISSGDTTITEKSVIQIVNSLGEPEDIFSDITESKKSAQNSKLTKDDVKDFFKREFHRNQKEGVVLGVCAGLGETFGINPIWLRIGFIILTLAYGINFIVYIVLGILLPDVSRKEQSSTKEPMEKIIERQVNEFAEDIHNRASTYYTSKNESVIVGAFTKLLRGIGHVFVAIFRTISLLIVFVILTGLSIGFFGAGLGALVAGGIFSSNLIIHSEQLFAYVPEWFSWVALTSGVSLILLSIMIGSRALRRPIGKGGLATLCIIILSCGIFGGIRAGVSVVGNYQYVGEKTLQKTTISTLSGSVYTLAGLDETEDYDGIRIGDLSNHGTIEFVHSPDNVLTIETIISLRARDKTKAEELFSLVTPTNIKTESGSIQFIRADKNNFTKPAPFSFIVRNIRISVPSNVSIISNSYRYRLRNVREINEGGLSFAPYCLDSKIIYSKDSNSFICPKKEEVAPDNE